MPESAGRAEKREKIRRGKRKRAAVAAMFVCLVVCVVCIIIGVVGMIVNALGGKPAPPGGGGESEPPVPPALSDTDYGPQPADAATISPPYIPYDYSKPARAIPAVSDGYFDDALVVGDLRLAGLEEDMPKAEFLLYGNVSVTSALEHSYTFGEGAATLAERLAARQFGSIYLAFGPNELGWAYPDEFAGEFASLVASVRAAQPAADIYICGLWPFSNDDAAANDHHSLANVRHFNSLLLALAKDTSNVYLELAEVFSNPDGTQKEGSTTAGYIPTAEYSDKLYQYLKTHTASKEYYGN